MKVSNGITGQLRTWVEIWVTYCLLLWNDGSAREGEGTEAGLTHQTQHDLLVQLDKMKMRGHLFCITLSQPGTEGCVGGWMDQVLAHGSQQTFWQIWHAVWPPVQSARRQYEYLFEKRERAQPE